MYLPFPNTQRSVPGKWRRAWTSIHLLPSQGWGMGRVSTGFSKKRLLSPGEAGLELLLGREVSFSPVCLFLSASPGRGQRCEASQSHVLKASFAP